MSALRLAPFRVLSLSTATVKTLREIKIVSDLKPIPRAKTGHGGIFSLSTQDSPFPIAWVYYPRWTFVATKNNAPRDVAEKLILEVASRCKPPLPEREALKKIEQAWKYEPGAACLHTDQRAAARKPVLDRVSEIEREEVSWLGHHRIPRGKITIVEGDPGQGKSFLTRALAAAVSRGYCFPDDEQKKPGNVIIMSAEDGAGDTIRPRLEDMQSDLERIALLRGMIDEKGNEAFLTLTDLDVIGEAIVQVEPALVIVDPIIAYDAGKDTHKASEVRSLLAPLASLAEKHNVAVICGRHLNKGNMKSNYRSQGSIDFWQPVDQPFCVDRTRRTQS
jgi:RecA-family ATPase